jgi:Uma2 family endonuclease
MNVQLPVHMDKAAFLAWAEGREERYELVEGRVVMMVNASWAHALMVSNLIGLLRLAVDLKQWAVVAEFGVDGGPRTLRFPDVMVTRRGVAPAARTAPQPAVLIEVLSPSTAKFDLGDKLAEFLHLPDLSAYLVFAQDEKKAWAWVRGEAGFTPAPAVFERDQATISLPALGVTMSLAHVYSDVALD